ncbi:DUF1679 domain-containing protein [Prolixibacteraceae bacterium JC049]|nr:DUF1679 domain-containing protein [Prolixibacteraceae bacterium JC049]
MNRQIQSIIEKATGASSVFQIEVIQNLWSGYGQIVRMGLEGSDLSSVVVKHVRLPQQKNHPRGWNTDRSHLRKIRSYEVETAFYQQWSKQCDSTCRIPKCLALETIGEEVVMVLEDLDSSGFSGRKSSVTWDDVCITLSWLANFHATFMHTEPENLWPIGTYWHLDTRPDEWNEMNAGALKNAAKAIDEHLNNAQFRTFVHGDAKLANFCYSDDSSAIAAVDFQYVGGGCGMKDVAYFVGSCMYEDDCEKHESAIIDFYFSELKEALTNRNSSISFPELEKEWRTLYHVAWADFHRFLKGWSPDHWKINSYSERVSRQVISALNS